MKNYLDLGRRILEEGETVEDRTGVGTKSLFGAQLRFDLRKGFPIVTTKKINLQPLIRELLWFLRGDFNTKTLGSKIWDAWAKEDGDLGPIYGVQWRSWGGVRVNDRHMKDSWYHGGIDQISQAIDMIKNNPDSRRIIVSAWNVSELNKMALPPCHCFFQFKVYGEHLDMQLYQRSADYAIGVPFNISSYALLLSMVANECGLTPRYFVHTFGDVHLYLNHVEKFKKQLDREPHRLPKLKLTKGKEVLKMTEEDIELIDYEHDKFIKFEVAV